jgi:transcription elongation factor Elf1
LAEKMPDIKFFNCPRCGNENLLDFDQIVECPKCGLSFTKEIITKIEEENIVADEELMEILKYFKKNGDIKSLKE